MNSKRFIGDYQVLDRIEGHGADLYAGKKGRQDYLLAFYDLGNAEAEQLETEIKRTMALTHPAILPVVEVVENEGSWVLVFEKVDGWSLAQLLAESGGERMSDAAAMHLVLGLFQALDAAHSAAGDDGKIAPLVHARLGTQQLFISWAGEVKLLGFGLSVLYRMATVSDKHSVEWTYAAPEVKAGGAYTVRANIFSSALVAWSLLSGETPGAEPPTPLRELRPDLPSLVTSTIDKALHPSLLERRVSARQLAGVVEPHGQDGAAQLKWFLEPMRAIENFDDVLMLRDSLPPSANFSSVPPNTIPPLISLLPESLEFVDAVVDSESYDDTSLTIPAPPKK